VSPHEQSGKTARFSYPFRPDSARAVSENRIVMGFSKQFIVFPGKTPKPSTPLTNLAGNV